MKRSFKSFIALALTTTVFVSHLAHAWMFGDNLTITAVMLWENEETNRLHFKTSAGFWCSVKPNQKQTQSLILTLYATQKPAMIHCYDAPESYGGESAHPLHRIIAK
jgi:hypothetical protein